MRKTYEPLALKSSSDDELHGILRKMLGELKLSHFGIHPKNVTAEQVNRETGYTGIDIIIINGEPLINRVYPNSPGAIAGIRTGFVLEKIDGVSVISTLAEFEKTIIDRPITDATKKIFRERQVELSLNGKPGTSVNIELSGPDNEKKEVRLKRSVFDGQMSQPFGNFPAQQVHFESRSIGQNIGYIRFNMWIVPQMAKLREAVRSFNSARAIIFDLRGNPGGIGGMAPGLAGLLMSEPTSLGTMRTRESVISFKVYPQDNAFNGKVVLLTDHGTGSTSEVFAGGMQDIGRATIVGESTAGGVLPSVFDSLPTGALFQYAISDFRTPKSTLLEGRGVFPDVVVAQTRDALLRGGDLQLEKALEIIENSK